MKQPTDNEPASNVVEVKSNGVFGRIRPTEKNGTIFHVLDYRINGARKLVWRSSVAEAKAAFYEAAAAIANGEQAALDLTSADRHELVRARDHLKGICKVDEAARDFAAAAAIIGDRVTLIEAVRFWALKNATVIKNISVADAAKLLGEELLKDGKSYDRRTQVAAALKPLAETFNGSGVDTITASLISSHLTGLKFANRTKANHREIIGFFNRWLILKNYLPKDSNWLDGVQKYSKAKTGENEIFTPEEIARLLAVAGRMTPFLAIAAFAGVRHATINRLDWSMIDLHDKADANGFHGFIKVPGAIGKNRTRYMVPIHANLAAWLKPFAQKSGAVVPFVAGQNNPATYTAKLLRKIAANTKTETAAAIVWKDNGLRHSYISYRLAECADIARVADEADNSPAIIKENYLQRVKPAQAAAWFNVFPAK